MILKNISLTPFGGLTNAQLDFSSGLNVIHGPNETGKSTIFNALQRVLFTQAHLTPSVFKREMASFLPLEGGDTIVVSLCLDLNGDTYALKRAWGSTKCAELTLPGGALITDEDAIQERLMSLLPAKEATFKTVLMTYQSGLAKTIEDLQSQQEPIQSLGTILRRALFETDGVSVDQFRQNIESEYAAYFSRWDRECGCPESDRRYKRDVGYILQVHYDIEDARTALQEARAYEAELDKVNSEINTCIETIENIEAYVEENERVVADARQRQALNDRIDAIDARMGIYRKDNSDWPVAESEIARIEGVLPGFKEKENALSVEQETARKSVERNQLRRQFEQVEKRRQELEVAELALEQTPKLTGDDLEALRSTYEQLNDLKTRRNANNANMFSVLFSAKAALSVSVQEGRSEPQPHDLASGDQISYEERSKIKICHQDWEIDIASGEINSDSLVEPFNETSSRLEFLEARYDVVNLKEAIGVHNDYTACLRDVNSARSNLEAELGDETYEDLQAKVAEIGTTEDSRDLESILEDLHSVRAEISEQERSLKQNQEKIQELGEAYGDHDKLFLKLAEEARAQKETRGKIEDLVPLPDGIDDIDSFIEMFEAMQAELRDTNDRKTRLLLHRSDIEKNEPELSAEELDNLLAESAGKSERISKRGEAVARIKDLTDRLIEEMDSNTYDGLVTDLERYTVSMTENRYGEIDMEESLPRGFVRQDGVTLPYDMLSAGTRDVLSLSLRLAMANHFLMDANGMLMLDDPLVDLDPRRQERAAQDLREFAEQKQVIVFTCHPHHAELLGGNRIELS